MTDSNLTDPPLPEPPFEAERSEARERLTSAGSSALVGLLMLLVGLVAGYLLRPLVPLPGAPASQQADLQATVEALTAAQAASASQQAVQEAQAANPTAGARPTLDPVAQATRKAQIMAAVLPQVRHFRGAEDAPVTVVEYSDFQ